MSQREQHAEAQRVLSEIRHELDNLEIHPTVRIHCTVRAISFDLDLAIAFYETYVPSGQDATLIDRMNKVDFYPAFNVISDSLHRNVIVTLCRIWDTRTDTADLNGLADEFRDPQVIADLNAIGHPVDPGQLSKWHVEIDAVNKSNELLALKRAGHRAIAHTANPNKRYQGKARVAQYGDERKIIERTIPLVEQAGAFIGYSYVSPYDEQRRIRREHATKFWAHVSPT
jgi:AbiU2